MSASIGPEQEAAIIKATKCTTTSLQGASSWAAKRQLKLWGMGPDGSNSVDHDTMVRLYMSIREVAPGLKISQHIMQEFKHKLDRVTSLKKLWMVPKDNVVDPKFQAFIVNHHELDEWPMGIDAEGVIVYDSAVPQIELGMGVMAFEVALHSRWTLKRAAPQETPRQMFAHICTVAAKCATGAGA